MSFKCKKCLRVKPVICFTIATAKDNICDFCRSGIDEEAVKREEEMERCIDCENRTPILTGYAETKPAKETQKVRNDISDIVEARRLAKELKNYE